MRRNKRFIVPDCMQGSRQRLAVRKTMKAMHAAYVKRGSQWKGAFEIRHLRTLLFKSTDQEVEEHGLSVNMNVT